MSEDDPTAFLGSVVPKEVVRSVPLSQKRSQTDFRAVLQFTVRYLRDEHSDGDDAAAFAQLLTTVENTPGTGDALTALFAGQYLLLRAALRQRVPVDIFESATRALGFAPPMQSDLTKVYASQLPYMQALAHSSRISYPRLEVDYMKWRLDVTISTTAMKRVMKPSVTMQLPLSDGSLHTFEVSVAEFHKLRFNVARVMKDMLDLEKAPILRID